MKNINLSRSLAAFVFCLPLLARADIEVVPEKINGIYECGEPIRYTIRETDGKAFTAHYEFKRGQITPIGQGELKIEGDSASTIETQLDVPGTVLLEVNCVLADGTKKKILRGAAVAPERLTPATSAPEDFDAFWRAKVDELNAVPMNPQLEAAPPTTQPTTQPINVDYYKITLDNIRGTKIHGQLAVPKSGGKFPALLIPQWAGIYPLEKAWAVDPAKQGWLTLNILAHDLPIDEPAEFYKQQLEGPLKNYWAIGNDDRDTSYYVRMYLSCYRAAEYLSTREEWDGKTIVVMGTSQGGMQSLMIAGLNPKITACIANVPAGCDFAGETVGRKSGWPQWSTQLHGKDPAKTLEASRYFDVVNFAGRIKCPTIIAMGLIDQTCPPEGIFIAANQITAPKIVMTMVNSDHQGKNDTQKNFYDALYGTWLPALRDGRNPTAP